MFSGVWGSLALPTEALQSVYFNDLVASLGKSDSIESYSVLAGVPKLAGSRARES
jgi:hypothetical protein